MVGCFREKQLLAAGSFNIENNEFTFAARERSDYADILLHESLTDIEASSAITAIFRTLLKENNSITKIRLNRVPQHSRFFLLCRNLKGFYCCVTNTTPAPRMDISFAEQALKKKSLVRHEKGLHKIGCVTVSTESENDKIQVHLDEFFEQHVERWSGTDSPSLFTEMKNRSFYRKIVEQMNEYGFVRFTRVLLNDKMVAAHFGFNYDGTYTWYKPTFSLALAKKSPGEVLLKQLIQLAAEEKCDVFDFTIGNEQFKYRFASDVQNVQDILVTSSRITYAYVRAKQAIKRLAHRG